MGSARLTPATYRRLTRDLLDADAPPSAWFDAAKRLHELLAETAGLEDPAEADAASQETVLTSGRALSPVDAGRCLLDLARTRAFLRGLTAAVVHQRTLHPRRPVHVLYAGCGPFATLALPLTTRFGADALRFTLIDVHEASMRGVARVALGDYDSGITFPQIVADAPPLEAGAEVTFDYHLDPPGLRVRQSLSPQSTQAAQ